MPFGNLMPWRKEEVSRGDDLPLLALHQHMNRLFDEVFRDFGLAPLRGFEDWDSRFMPGVEVTEDEQNVRITAELPGMSENDLEVEVGADAVRIKGEKRHEKKEDGKGYHRSELAYGSFVREIPLPAEVQTDKSEGAYKNGVLTITLPKTEQSKANRKRLSIKSE